MYDMSELRRRYHEDANFHAVVSQLYHMIDMAQLTPDEMRKALFLACYKYEMEHVRPILINEHDIPTGKDRDRIMSLLRTKRGGDAKREN